MKNLDVVFRAIKGQCKEINIPGKKCIATLEDMRKDNGIAHPIYFYVVILEDLGFINYSRQTDEITVTERGREADSAYSFGDKLSLAKK